MTGWEKRDHFTGETGLSEKTKRRLEVLGWYFRKSVRHSANGKKNAALTCRHFGCHRSQFYRWLVRYDKTRLVSLDPSSTAHRRNRDPGYSRALITEVRRIRKDDPTYSGKKIRPILLRSRAPYSKKPPGRKGAGEQRGMDYTW